MFPRFANDFSVSVFFEDRANTAELFFFFRMLANPFTPERFSRVCTATLVFGALRLTESTKSTSPSLYFLERIVNNALAFIFLETFLSKFFSFLGPCATPPPTHIGERVEPW